MISSDGRFITYTSEATNLVASDINGYDDIFLYEIENGSTTRVSETTNGQETNNTSFFSRISFDGRYVSFSSQATNLITGDTTSGWFYSFVRDMETGNIERVSVSAQGDEADQMSFTIISGDGKNIVVLSSATNLVEDDTNEQFDMFFTSNPLYAAPAKKAYSHSYEFDSAMVFESSGEMTMSKFIIDNNNNEYISLQPFSEGLDLDADQDLMTADIHTENGNTTIMKYNSNDEYQCHYTAPGTKSYLNNMVSTSDSGIIIGGRFEGTVDFDTGVGTTSFTAQNRSGIILKIDSTCNYVWGKQIDGDDWEHTNAYSTNGEDIYISGRTESTSVDLSLGNNTDVYTNPNPGKGVGFLLKMNKDGVISWSKTWESSESISAKNVAIDSNNNIYLTIGHSGFSMDYSGTQIDLDPGSAIDQYTISKNLFHAIVMLDQDGDYIRSYMTDLPHLSQIKVDSNDNLYVGGGI